MRQKQQKILLIADTPDWAFARECDALVKYLGMSYDFDLCYFYEDYKCGDYRGYKSIKDVNINDYDLILIKGFLWFPTKYLQGVNPNKVAISINSHHCFDRDDCKSMMFNSSHLYRHVLCISDSIYKRSLQAFGSSHNIYFTPDGVDTDVFFCTNNQRQKTYTVGWCGNAAHGDDHKRFYSLVVPIIKKCASIHVDIKLAARNIDKNIVSKLESMGNVEINEYSYDCMPKFYNSVDSVINCSKSESVCQPIIEAIACGRQVISTDTGYAKNLIIEKANGMIVHPSDRMFFRAIKIMRESNFAKAQNLNRFISENIISWKTIISYTDIVLQKILRSAA